MTSHPDFPRIQQRLAALKLYNAPIDDDWGPGMLAGINAVLAIAEKAAGIAPPPPLRWPGLKPAYAWLRSEEGLPRHLVAMLDTYGVTETAGTANNPVIMNWVKVVNDKYPGKVQGYTADSIPHCGLGIAYAVTMAGREPVDQPLWALNWGKFGEDGGQPELGDILTFKRPSGGHVALYIGEDATTYHILGANQSDQVNIMRIEKSRMVACRQPAYINKPASVRPRILAATGAISRNEA